MKTNLGLSFSLDRITEKQEFLCTDLEVWFVLEGSIRACLNQAEFDLDKEDIILFNPGSAYSFDSKEENIICCARFSTNILHQILKGAAPILNCNSALDINSSYQELRNIFYELLELQVRHQKQSVCMTDSLMLKLLDSLIRQFKTSRQDGKSEKDGAGNDETVRFQKMIRYINLNYQSDINLSALAGEMYVSASTLSRLFHKYAGMYFADYVTQVRLRHACEDLAFTQKNLTRVAVDNGFSSSSAFNRVFKKAYNTTPSAYRQEREAQDIENKAQKEQEQELLLQEVLEKQLLQTDETDRCSLILSADDEGEKWDKNWNIAINIGTMYDLTLANIQNHVLYLQEHLSYGYVRIWNVFSKRMMISDGRTKGNYNFMLVDQVLDFLLKNYLCPFLDLGRKPNVIKRADTNVVRYEEEYIDFQSREIWEDCLTKLIRHLTDRYGTDEMSKWIFEITRDGIHNDIGYYQDPEYDFFQVYSFAYRLIRDRVPGARIGGVSAIIYNDMEYLSEFYQRCVDENCIPDFVSMFTYPYIPFETDNETRGMRISPDKHNEAEQVRMMKSVMRHAGISDCKLYISEFNNSVSNRNLLNDSCFRSAYYCRKTGEIAQDVDMICYMAGSDWINSYIDFNLPANGSVGMLTKDSICKPVYWSVQFLNMTGSRLLERTDHYIATKSSKGDYYILCNNMKWYHRKYFLKPENIDLRTEPDQYFEDAVPLDLSVQISDLEDGEYVVKTRRMNRSEGSLLAEWAKLDFATDLTRQDIRYLLTASFPRLTMQKQKTDQGKFSFSIELEAHEVCMIHIYRFED